MSSHSKKYTLLIFAILFWLGITLVVILNKNTLKDFSTYGYVGIFLIGILSNATLVFPIPGLLAPFLGGAIFNPLTVGFVSGAGQAIGELTGYWVGHSGHDFVDNYKIYGKIENLMKRYGDLFIFFFALIPNFLFDLGGIAAGATGMPVWRFLLATFLGKTARAFLMALLGSYLPS